MVSKVWDGTVVDSYDYRNGKRGHQVLYDNYPNYHPFWHEMLGPEDGHVACNDPQLDARCRSFVSRFKAGRAGTSCG